jgi:hypothetical protein
VEAHKALGAAAPQIGIPDLTHLMGPGQTKPDETGQRPTGVLNARDAAA